MFYVTRKLTGKVVGRMVPEDTIETYLSVLPAGVYAIEDSDGNELNEVRVRAGCVEYRYGWLGTIKNAAYMVPLE